MAVSQLLLPIFYLTYLQLTASESQNPNVLEFPSAIIHLCQIHLLRIVTKVPELKETHRHSQKQQWQIYASVCPHGIVSHVAELRRVYLKFPSDLFPMDSAIQHGAMEYGEKHTEGHSIVR